MININKTKTKNKKYNNKIIVEEKIISKEKNKTEVSCMKSQKRCRGNSKRKTTK